MTLAPTMDPHRWRRVEELYHAALARPADERTAYLLGATDGDQALFDDVRSLLDAPVTAQAFLGAPVALPSEAVAGPVLIGRRLGVYHLLESIGAGGMGEVYRARDTRLGRDVAIKILPALFTSDSSRLAHFEREARALAALNHPNVATIHGVEESGGIRALVMELVEGDTLAKRIGGGRMPWREAVEIAIQIAAGLDAAHEKGIVHRDLKPANVKVTSTGAAKVLDFGLAKATTVAGIGAQSGLTTFGSGSGEGTILGTAAYMSPEQARGNPVDGRTDIWAFGCVLYEMLAGRPVYGGATIPDILAAVLEHQPDWSALPDVPQGIVALLRRCLQRDLHKRARDIADVRNQLEDVLDAASDMSDPGPIRRRRWLVFGGAVTVVIAALITATVWLRPAPVSPAEMRLEVVTPPSAHPTAFAISPDARSIVFQATVDGRTQLWRRALNSQTSEPLAGTEGTGPGFNTWPFWAPDGRSIAFLAGGSLKRYDLASGTVQTLVAATGARRGGTWSTNGDILLWQGTGPILRVDANGLRAIDVTRLLPDETNHRLPHFLPDGRHFLFLVLSRTRHPAIYLGELGSLEARRLIDTDSAAVFVPPDQIMFSRAGSLWAQRIDPTRLDVMGEPAPVASEVLTHPLFTGHIALSASSTGPVAFRPNAADRQFIWLDRGGQQVGTLGAPDAGQPGDLRLSPDGRSVALRRTVDGGSHVWMMDTDRGIPRRLIFNAFMDLNPVFSPDGTQIAFARSELDGANDLYVQPVDGSAAAELLLQTPAQENPSDWSPDGRYILFSTQGLQNGDDLWVVPVSGDRQPRAVAQTVFSESLARFSPDGQWIAYQSNETGQFEIYVQPFPGPGSKVRISDGGGTEPKWRNDGTELFYVGAAGGLMTVRITTRSGRFEAATPSRLFGFPASSDRGVYAPSADGQRFLISAATSDPSPLTLLMNWKPRPQ